MGFTVTKGFSEGVLRRGGGFPEGAQNAPLACALTKKIANFTKLQRADFVLTKDPNSLTKGKLVCGKMPREPFKGSF